jgi:cell division protein YceG involved in septum cleavage
VKYFLTVLGLACCLWYSFFMDEPKQTVAVTVTVQAGDTLEEIIYDLKEAYDDQRDWREICAQAEMDNAFGRYILPGEHIIFNMEVAGK